VAVEKGTKAVISVNFSVYGLRTFNNLTYERISLLKFLKKTFSTPTPHYANCPLIGESGGFRQPPGWDKLIALFNPP
jgi:hypothetical protein